MATAAGLLNGTRQTEPLLRVAADVGLAPGAVTLSRLGGGANNQVFLADDGKARFVIKSYFRHEADSRDRRAAEFAFSTYAWSRGIRCIAEPVATYPADALSVFTLIGGQPIDAGTLADDTKGDDAIAAALDFVAELNTDRSNDRAAGLPSASEACFSLDAHLVTVAKRVERLRSISSADDIDARLESLVADELLPAWDCIADETRVLAEARGIAMDAEITDAARCLSPSDFGFHNALRDDAGIYRFFDFEYAGWDDPAKLFADFFCQKAVPVPLHYAPAAMTRLADMLNLSKIARHRMALLLAVYQIKWCCILLNEFLPAGRARRSFATDAPDPRPAQLDKAQQALNGLLGHTALRDQLLNN